MLKNWTSFSGMATVLGKDRHVRFEHIDPNRSDLVIQGVTVEEAQALLGALANPNVTLPVATKAVETAAQAGRVRIENLPETTESSAPPASTTKPKKDKTPAAEKPAKASKSANGTTAAAAPAPAEDGHRHSPNSARVPVPASAPKASAVESDFEVDEGDEEDDGDLDTDQEDPIADELEAGAGDDDAPDGPTPIEDLLPYLKKRQKLQPIIFDLLDSGYRTVDAIVEACEKLKASVPVLGRVPNFKERIPTALEAYGVDDPTKYNPDNRADFDQSERLF